MCGVTIVSRIPDGRKLVPQATLMITKRILSAKTVAPKRCAGKIMHSAHMRQGRLAKLFFVLFAACLVSLLVPRMASAQASSLEIPPPPPPAEPPPPPEPPKPVFDPLRANKSIEVGSFYMKRGNYDAAIDRFTDATQFEPGLARSYSLLGEAYEHKGDVDNALVAYRKYFAASSQRSRPRQSSEAH